VQKELGKYCALFAKQLKQKGWSNFVKALQHPGDIAPTIHTIHHPIAPYLSRLSKFGVPAPSAATPWSRAQRRRAVNRGAHSSAKIQFKEFLFHDMLDMIQKRYWVVLPYSAVRNFPHLKLAPVGVVPQRTRRPRPIMDYTFNEVNQHSLPLAKLHAMQFGHALHRILHRIAYANPDLGPVLMAKFDLADGYYRIPLSPQAALELAVVLPPMDNNLPLVGIPLVLPMGWKYSPPYFCSYTETAADLANNCLANNYVLPDHHLTPLINSFPTTTAPLAADAIQPPLEHQPAHSLSYVDVYMDDFIGLAQPSETHRTHRALLHSVDKIFRANTHPADPPNRKDIISRSKLAQGDGTWATTKTILGWLINTADKTLRLPQHKADRLHTIIQSFLPLRRTSRKKWQQLLGELRHMALAIPGARYLFSILQHVLIDQPHSSRLRLKPLVLQALQDWTRLATALTTCPTPIQTLVPTPPTFLGAVDASGAGLGGFYMATPYEPYQQAQPIIFRVPFPIHVQQRLVTHLNTTGDITNSDLELAALVLGAAILRTTCPQSRATILCASDNAAAVQWAEGSTSSTKARAFLLRWLANLTRHNSFALHPVFTPGTTNTLADFCSRSFHLSDQEFSAEVHSRFPIPGGWNVVHPPSDHVSNMISALLGEMSPWVCPGPEPMQPAPPGICGKNSANHSPSTLQSSTYQTPSLYFKSLPTATAKEKYLPASLRSVAAQWATPFVPLARRWPTWDFTIHA